MNSVVNSIIIVSLAIIVAYFIYFTVNKVIEKRTVKYIEEIELHSRTEEGRIALQKEINEKQVKQIKTLNYLPYLFIFLYILLFSISVLGIIVFINEIVQTKEKWYKLITSNKLFWISPLIIIYSVSSLINTISALKKNKIIKNNTIM